MSSTDTVEGQADPGKGRSVFGRVVVGVDGTEPGFEACRQAGRLADPEAAIDAVAVVLLAEASGAGFDAPRFAKQFQREAEEALDEAMRILGARGRTCLVKGNVTPSLLSEIRRARGTLVALGSHGHHRATEIMIGGVAGELLHNAPCSVLIARPPTDPATFPAAIVVGMDGSEAADAAFAAAAKLRARVRRPLRVVAATQGKHVDLARVQLRAPAAEAVDEHPVAALVDASRAADLVVVGSRGLHGLRALGSVSERVAHRAACSVLVVRQDRP